MHQPTPAGSELEQMWADEVRHLHSLWHLGPPLSSAGRRPCATAPGLGAVASTTFKRSEQRRRRRDERMQRRAAKKLEEQLNLWDGGPRAFNESHKAASSVIEWPCEPPPVSLPERGWSDPNSTPAVPPVPAPPASEEDQRRFAGMRLHQIAMKACGNFFSREESSDVDDEDQGEDDDPMDGDGSGSSGDQGGSRYFDFFVGLFKKEGELRAYYEKNWEKGEFWCVVCAGMEAKAVKRYGDCVALVQHSSSIAKTKKKEAHRAFGRAICRVLGWDMARLPSIVLDMGETLGQVLAKATGLEEDDVHKQNGESSVEISQPNGTDDGCSQTGSESCDFS